jgi:hypothetical protein
LPHRHLDAAANSQSLNQQIAYLGITLYKNSVRAIELHSSKL